MELTNEDVQDILALLDTLPYDELDLATSRFRLSLRRSPGSGWTQSMEVVSPPNLVTPPPRPGTEAAAPGPVPAGPGVAGDTAEAADLVAVRAPLPGTFYRAPRPGAPPFVEVGSQVDEDTVVGIVETMKLMNSVHAGVRGRIAEICLADAAPADAGATLMRVEVR